MGNKKQDPNQLNELAMQDTSSNALTEVALGLSMAFFALLVLALVSMVLPVEAGRLAQSAELASIKPKVSSHQGTQQKDSEALFLFYYDGKMVDQNMSPREFEAIASGRLVVLAIAPTTSFENIIHIQNSLSHVDLQLTKLPDTWRATLSKHFERL